MIGTAQGSKVHCSPSLDLHPPPHSTAEQQAEQLAYEREYEDDYSWEQLEEDEHGNLRAPVRSAQRAVPLLTGPAACLSLPCLHLQIRW